MDIALTRCGEGEWDTLIAFARAFCAEDGHPHGPENEEALHVLMDNPLYGRALMIRRDGAPVGYAVLCYGYSLEFLGRDGFIDEFYVAPEHRGLGIASRALEAMQEIARADGIRSLHLEVMDTNPDAARLYRRYGWEMRESRMMTKQLTRAGD